MILLNLRRALTTATTTPRFLALVKKTKATRWRIFVGMGFIGKVKRSRGYQAISGLVLLLLVYLLFFRSSDSSNLSNEEINNILSGQEQSGSDVERVRIENQLLKSPYLETDLKSKNWDIEGDTLIKNNYYVRLTSEKKDQTGSIFNKHPFSDDGFEVTFKFSINGKARVNGLKGDGFAMFLTDKKLTQGPVFGSQDYFNGLGVFFDTYRNAKKGPMFPYINVMNGDGSTSYDKNNDGSSNQLGGCSARGIYNSRNNLVEARLIHTTQDGYLSLDYKIDDSWKNCFTIKDVHIPKERYLGFSANTGDLFANHDIFEVDVFTLKQDGESIQSFQDVVVGSGDSNDESEQGKESDEVEDDDDDPDHEIDYKGRRRRRRNFRKKRNAKQRAKLKNRLRNSERRMQQRRANEDSDFAFFGTLWKLIKYFFLLIFILIIAYVAFTFYRIKMRSKRINLKRSSGILM